MPDQESAVELELRTGNDSFATAFAVGDNENEPGRVRSGNRRLEGEKKFRATDNPLASWPTRLTAEIEVGPEKSVLELGFRVSGLTAVEVHGFTLQEVAR